MLKKYILLVTTLLLATVLVACVKKPDTASFKHTSKASAQSMYAQNLEQLNQEIESLSERAETMPNSWFALELVAQRYLDRARLTGNYEDYTQAEVYLERAFAISGLGGPHMTQARLDFSLHRLESTATNIEVIENGVLVDNIKQANIIGVQSDLALYRGEYQNAFEGYQTALALHEDSTALFRLAVYHWRMGDFEEAEALIDKAAEAANNISPRLDAFFHLHRGLFDLDRGRYDDALVHYQAANATFDGWWLVKEHIAEIYVLQGKLKAAKNIYEDVLAETGSPEFMDAMAGIANSEKEAAEWLSKARDVYEAQLQQFPEASYGHALGHYLDAGDAPQKALELAEANYALRPYGESEVLLARAYLQVGQLDRAQTMIEKTLASSWRSAELHATAATIFEATGDEDRAKLELTKALAINPNAL